MSDTDAPPKLPAPGGAPLPAIPRPKILKRLPIAGEPPPAVPARMINEVLYCERLAYLEWVQGEFDDNFFTVEGRAVHARVDEGGKTRKRKPKRGTKASADAPPADEPPAPLAPEVLQTRSLWLTSERLGITAKIDLVEESIDGSVVPVEHKRGHKPEIAEGAYLPERAQLCAQVLLLRDHGYRCDEAMIYFAADRARVAITIDEALVARTLGAVARLRELAGSAEIPPPLDDDPRCNGCSLVGICLPDEVQLLRRLAGELLDAPVEDEPPRAPFASDVEGALANDPWGLVGDAVAPVAEIRRLAPARDERLPLYVQAQGAKLSLDGDELLVQTKDGPQRARLPNTSQVDLLGNVQVSTQVIRALLERGIPLAFFTYGGWFLGRTMGAEPKNVELRVAQHRGALDKTVALTLSRRLVASKILNCRTMLRRNHAEPSEVALFELKQLARKALEAASIESLLGTEGTAARVYFAEFTGMLKQDAARTFDLDGRNRRPPRDPVNALLSFAYSLLTKDFSVTLATVGLDPMLGFFHQPRFGRPSLALDLMEEFRPLVADSTVLVALNTGVVQQDDFVQVPGACSLSAAGRKRFIMAYERRMDQLVTHPVFGYRISYRRVLEVQARLLGRYLLGEIDDYPVFRTR